MEPPDALRTFRRSFYECLHRRSDALFELADAILTADGAAPSPAHLSLQASHRRGWGSLYAALWRGRIDDEALGELLVHHPLVSTALKGRRPSTLWTRACGHAATRSAVPSAATTTIRRGTPPASPSSQAGPTSSLHNSTLSARAGPPPWTWSASGPPKTPTRSPPGRSGPCWVGSQEEGPYRCSSSTRATTPSSCSGDSKGARARSSYACAPGVASTATRASRLRPRTSDVPVATGRR